WIGDVVQQIKPLVVMDADAAFLDGGVDARKINLERGSKRYRPKRAMGRNRYIIGFGHGRDPEHLGYAAGMAQIGLDDRHMPVVQQLFEIPARIHPLARGDGNTTVSRNVMKGFGVLAEYRFFNKHRMKRAQLIDERPDHSFMHPPVEVEPDIQVIAEFLTQQTDVLDDFGDVFLGGYPCHWAGSIHLYRTVSRIHPVL